MQPFVGDNVDETVSHNRQRLEHASDQVFELGGDV